jgi:hypothetical protein
MSRKRKPVGEPVVNVHDDGNNVDGDDEEDEDARIVRYLGKKLGITDAKAEKKVLSVDGLDCA